MSRPRRWRDLVRLFDFRCAYCQRAAKLTKDHVVPRAKGGRFRAIPDNTLPWDNIVPACPTCNRAKDTHELWIEWTPPNPHPALKRLHPMEVSNGNACTTSA